jgi:hypothetical protein
MVDFLARDGKRLPRCIQFFVGYAPITWSANAWGFLLGTYKVRGEVRIDLVTAPHLFSMEVGYIGNYIVMKNGEVLSMSGN